jgi:hypothetical protein
MINVHYLSGIPRLSELIIQFIFVNAIIFSPATVFQLGPEILRDFAKIFYLVNIITLLNIVVSLADFLGIPMFHLNRDLYFFSNDQQSNKTPKRINSINSNPQIKLIKTC